MLESSWILVACGYALITGYAARGTRWAPALSSVLLALVLMFVTVRATSDAMFGLRPTSLVLGGGTGRAEPTPPGSGIARRGGPPRLLPGRSHR